MHKFWQRRRQRHGRALAAWAAHGKGGCRRRRSVDSDRRVYRLWQPPLLSLAALTGRHATRLVAWRRPASASALLFGGAYLRLTEQTVLMATPVGGALMIADGSRPCGRVPHGGRS